MKRRRPSTGTKKTGRSHGENQERAFIAASRRSDRSIEARLQSAMMASEVHKRRTGKRLRITEEIVLREEMYEEEDDDNEASRHLRISAHSGTPMTKESLANLDQRFNAINREFAQKFPGAQAQLLPFMNVHQYPGAGNPPNFTGPQSRMGFPGPGNPSQFPGPATPISNGVITPAFPGSFPQATTPVSQYQFRRTHSVTLPIRHRDSPFPPPLQSQPQFIFSQGRDESSTPALTPGSTGAGTPFSTPTPPYDLAAQYPPGHGDINHGSEDHTRGTPVDPALGTQPTLQSPQLPAHPPPLGWPQIEDPAFFHAGMMSLDEFFMSGDVGELMGRNDHLFVHTALHEATFEKGPPPVGVAGMESRSFETPAVGEPELAHAEQINTVENVVTPGPVGGAPAHEEQVGTTSAGEVVEDWAEWFIYDEDNDPDGVAGSASHQ